MKPEFPQSETMGRVSREARLLFLQLFTLVDDEGRARGNPELLRGLLYPYDSGLEVTTVDGWLRELVRERAVRVYVVRGEQYLEVRQWKKHQKIDHPTRSKLPAPSRGFARARRSLAPDLDLDLDQDRKSNEEQRGPRHLPENDRVLTKLAHTVLDDVDAGRLVTGEVSEELKCRAARAQLRYDGDRVRKALDCAEVQRRRAVG